VEIGIVGKPNVGKSTFFNALTLLDVPMAPYPFTTVTPNRGVAAIRAPCPHTEKGTPCTPGNAKCVDGTRWVPVSLIDVPGLVPGAHAGRGLGHKFLDDLRAADGFVQVVDLSGATDDEGRLQSALARRPFAFANATQRVVCGTSHGRRGIRRSRSVRHARGTELDGTKVEDFLSERLTGLAISPAAIATALRGSTVERAHPARWTEEDRAHLARQLLEASKPRLVAANKCDRASRDEATALAGRIEPIPSVPTAADAELTLRRAARAGLVEYHPGDPSFRTQDPSRLSAPQLKALEGIRSILATWGSTGVQQSLEEMVYSRLGMIVVYPVEDETHWTDSQGRVLPDAFLVPANTPARAVAYRVHTDLGEHFIRAIDGRTHRAMAADHPLAANAVVRIVARK
jgi:ribosome-binding ATPase YchF (GTP1/OBG family)